MSTNAIIFSLIAAIIIENIVHYRERKDLYSRIMAKDLLEYNIVAGNKTTKKSGNPIKSKMDKYLNGEIPLE